MTISQKTWVKRNKKMFANNLIKQSGAKYDGDSSGIFMAGLPGAGKTELTKNLIASSDLRVVRLDMDEIASRIEGYSPDKADKFRAGASELLNKCFDLTLKKKLDFIMDGTFSSPYASKNIGRVLKHNYTIKIVYVLQDPKIAWEFTKAREKVEHRAIDINGFINAYFGIIKNLECVFNKKYDKMTIDVVVKNGRNEVEKWLENVDSVDLDKINKNVYNKTTLMEYLNG